MGDLGLSCRRCYPQVKMDQEAIDEIKRHFGVVSEQIRGDVRAVAEALVVFREETTRRFDEVEQRFEQVDRRFDAIAHRFEQVDRRFDEVDRKFEQVGHEFEETRSLIRLSYTELDRRVRTVETEVAELRARLERVEARQGA